MISRIQNPADPAVIRRASRSPTSALRWRLGKYPAAPAPVGSPTLETWARQKVTAGPPRPARALYPPTGVDSFFP